MVRQSWQERLLSRQTRRTDESDGEPSDATRQEVTEKSAGIEKTGEAPKLLHTVSEVHRPVAAVRPTAATRILQTKCAGQAADDSQGVEEVPKGLEKHESLIEHAPVAAADPPTGLRPTPKRQWRRDRKVPVAASDQPLNITAALQIVRSKRAERQNVDGDQDTDCQAGGSAENKDPLPERVPAVSSDRLQQFRTAAGRREHRADDVATNGLSFKGVLDVASSSLHNLIPIADGKRVEEKDIRIKAEDTVLDVASSSLHKLIPRAGRERSEEHQDMIKADDAVLDVASSSLSKLIPRARRERSEEHQDIGIKADDTEEKDAPSKQVPVSASGLAQHLFRHSMQRMKNADQAAAKQIEERHQNMFGSMPKEVFDVASDSLQPELQDTVCKRAEEEKRSPLPKQAHPVAAGLPLNLPAALHLVRTECANQAVGSHNIERRQDTTHETEDRERRAPLPEEAHVASSDNLHQHLTVACDTYQTKCADAESDRQNMGQPRDRSCQEEDPASCHQEPVSMTEGLEKTCLHSPLRSDHNSPLDKSNLPKPRPSTESWLVTPPTFKNSDAYTCSVSEAEGSAENNSSSRDEDETRSDSTECEGWWEEEPKNSVYPTGDGFWEAGGLEFFSCFDSGNCAGVVVTPTPSSRSQASDSSPAQKKSADAIWASAAATESSKLLYEVVQMRCHVHAAPDLASKVITKKSKGAKFFAGNRATSDGWQPLVGEKGWVCLFNSSLPAGERNIARWISEWGGSAVRHYGEPDLRFCTLIPDAALEKTCCAKKVLRVLIGGVYFLLRLDALPLMRGTVFELEESVLETKKPARPAPAQIAPAIDPDTLSFDVQVRADCAGTPYAKDDCQWFYFGVQGQPESTVRKLRFRLLGLSRFKKFEATGVKKGPLSTDGVRPLFRFCAAGAPASNTDTDREWSLVDGYGVEKMPDGRFACTFEHSLGGQLKEGTQLVFALTFPYPLARVREHVNMAYRQFKSDGAYVCREHLVNSLGGHPIELFTISARSGRSAQRQPPLLNLLNTCRRPRLFPGRKAIFVSCRVHPGETPASYMLEGLLDFLVSADPAARELLQRYVIHIIPVLNPDGVVLGHHRTDLLGENLNRVYGREAQLAIHPAIYAAQDACNCAHQHQGGLRLYLDLHAHSNRRGAFLLGDADVEGGAAQAKARLFGYALCRRCSVFEFGQSDFKHAVPGTGKSGIGQLTGAPLCFTVESHYFRGHHSTIPFGPDTWRGIGRSCLEALLDCDHLEENCFVPQSSLQDCVRHEDLHHGLQWFTGESFKGTRPRSHFEGPGRVHPRFGSLLGPMNDHIPSPDVTVEIIEHEWRSCGSSPPECWLRLHEEHGGIWVPSTDVELCDSQTGTFFYGVLTTAAVSADPVRGKRVSARLPPGTVIEVAERRVVDGFLRVRMTSDSLRGNHSGWLSEYKSTFFDPRLGGIPQLMRLKAPPVKTKTNGLFYAFSS